MTNVPSARRILFVAAHPSIDRQYTVARLVPREIHRPESVVAVPGGKGLNAARAAAALGGNVAVVGIVGGRTGDWIVDRLADLAVTARFVRTAIDTRTCISVLDESTGELTEIYERGEQSEPGTWDALEALVADELARGDVAAVTLSGSLQPGMPDDGYARVAHAAAESNAAVLADTYGTPLRAVLAERPAIVKVNAREASDATGIDVSDVTSAAHAAERLREAGAASAVVTLGFDGAVVVDGDGARRHLQPPKVSAPYMVGSGDAFLGALAVAHARGERLLDAARLGVGAGMANAMVPGPGILERDQAEHLAGLVEVTRI